jgi:Right handed beta helix region
MRRASLILATLSFLIVAPIASARSVRDGLTLIVVDTPDIAGLHAAREFVQQNGGRVGVMVPPSILIGWVDPSTAPRLLGRMGIRDVRWTELPTAELDARDESALTAVRTFNSVVRGDYDRRVREETADAGDAPTAETAPRAADGITPPDIDRSAVLENLAHAGLDERTLSERRLAPGNSPSIGNSDAMTGTVAVSFFLVESDGSGADPNSYTWTPEDMQKYMDAAVVGLLWWVQQATGYRDCAVTFLVNYYSAFDPRCQQWVEPSTHTSGYVSVWSANVMANFGYTSGDHFSRVTAFNTWQRATYQTDRSYSAFICYNPIGAPSSFSDGGYAFAWIYGPYFWSLFRTTGWTHDVVVSHESGHIFGACDEYTGGCSSCSSSCDYQGTPNANCEACNPLSRPCIMRNNEPSVCQYTKGMIGWDVNTPCGPAPPTPLPAPTVASVSPGNGLVGDQVHFDITGSNFVAGVQADLGPDVFVHETQLVSPTSLAVWISIFNAASTGPVDVVVRNRDGQTATLPDAFVIQPTLHHYFSPTGGNQFPFTSPAMAGTSLPAVIAAAAEGDTILMPTTTLSNISVAIDRGVVLQGAWDASFTTRDLVSGKTVIDLNGIVDFYPGTTGGGLDGFIVENGDGKADAYPYSARFAGAIRILTSTASIANCEIRTSETGPGGAGYGGAIFAYQSTVTISNCWIHDNTATRGGAVYLDGCSGAIDNSMFDANRVTTSGAVSAEGSAVYLHACTGVSLTADTLTRNTGGQNGGGVLAENSTGIAIDGGAATYNTATSGGGGVAFVASSGSVHGVTLTRNTGFLGGALLSTSSSDVTLYENRFGWNSGTIAGGVFVNGGTAAVEHNVFVGNVASSYVAGLAMSSASSGSVAGNTFDRNSVTSGAGALAVASSPVPVFDNLVGNSTGDGIACSGTPPTFFDNNDVWNSSGNDYVGCAPGPGSISGDAAFADTASGDYHLGLHSPAIDAGRPGASYDDPDGSRGDMGRYGAHAFVMDQPVYVKNLVAELPVAAGNSPASMTATLRWNKNPEGDLSGYAVYCDTVSGFTPGVSNFLAFVAAPDSFLAVSLSDSLYYRVNAIDTTGYAGGYSDEVFVSPATAVDGRPLALTTTLYPNVPNPFNPETTIRFDLAASMPVRLTVYDVGGHRVAVLVNETRGGGPHAVRWRGIDDRGRPVASGVYFYRLEAGRVSETRKMVLLK